MKVNQQLWQSYSEPYFHFSNQYEAATFAIITAWNPESKRLSDIDNKQRNEALKEELTGLHMQTMWAGNRDFSWKEESFAVAISRERAIELGKKYQQNAIYFIERERLFLLSCLEDATETELGYFQCRCVEGFQI